jgi:SAM-dependent methyltransferase
MNKQEINQILKLNKQFYQLIAKDFSKTRQKPWEGWGRVAELIEEHVMKQGQNPDAMVKILDLGSGNGRFFKFLCEKMNNFEYTGVDINNDLLEEAKRSRAVSETQPVNVMKNFKEEDIFKNLDKIQGKYNMVTAFGVTHHIPNENFRKKWFSQIPLLLKEDSKEPSLIALSFWDFEKEPGDYLLGWDGKKEVTRYCHKYSEEELNYIIELYEKLDLSLIDRYISDNKNIYLIFGKI